MTDIPRVLVEVRGGVAEISIDGPCRVRVIDYDIDGIPEDEFTDVDGTDAAVTTYNYLTGNPNRPQFDKLWEATED